MPDETLHRPMPLPVTVKLNEVVPIVAADAVSGTAAEDEESEQTKLTSCVMRHRISLANRDHEEGDAGDAERGATRVRRAKMYEETFEAHQHAAAARRIIMLAEGAKVTTFMGRMARKRTDHPHIKSVGHVQGSSSPDDAVMHEGDDDDDDDAAAAAAATWTSQSGSAAVEKPAVSGEYEGYNFEVDESCVHFDMKAESHRSRHELYLLLETFAFTIVIGVLLGVVAAAITACEGLLIRGRNGVVQSAFGQGQTASAYAGFVLLNTLFILLASLLTYWAPRAVTSGLPAIKAHLNGVTIPELLTLRTLVAKTVGVTFVVATGLPLGREGPMVHTGAIVASQVTRATISVGGSTFSTPIEVRVPSAQRSWVGIGCAAGVAAAFSAPLGGLLYSFEEVCSHWSEKMTWKAFACTVVAAIMYNVLIR
jgi:hypothetical protein